MLLTLRFDMMPSRSHPACGSVHRRALSSATATDLNPTRALGSKANRTKRLAAHASRAVQQLAREYLERNAELTSHHLGSCDPGQWQIEELTEGRINYMYRVTGPAGSVCLKCYMPYAKAAGESFPLSLERMAVEAAAMQQLHGICPHHIPQVLHYDPAASLLLLQYLPAPHQKLLTGLEAGLQYPRAPTQLAHLLGSYLWETSVYCLSPDEYRDALERYSNTEVQEANENVVLRWPFREHASNWCSPGLEPQAAHLRSDPGVQAAVEKLLATFSSQKESLIHSDLHTGNLLVTPPPSSSLYLIDWEFACYGPMAYDLGSLIANLLLSFFALSPDTCPAASAASSSSSSIASPNLSQQQGWILQAISEFWKDFTSALEAAKPRPYAPALHEVGDENQQPPPPPPPQQQQQQQQEHRRQEQQEQQQQHHQHQKQQELQRQQQHRSLHHSPALATPPPPDSGASATPLPSDFPARLLSQTAGFAAVCMMRLIVGMHHHPSMLAIPCPAQRAQHESAALRCALELLLGSDRLREGGDIVSIAGRHAASTPPAAVGRQGSSERRLHD